MPTWSDSIFSGAGIQTIAAIVSAVATVASATFAWFIFRLGQAQLKTFDRQADVATHQAEVARMQADIAAKAADQDARLLVLTQRPRIIVDRVAFLGDERTQFPPEQLPTVRIELVNVGGTRARIRSSTCMFYFEGGGLPPRMTYRAANEGQIFNLPENTEIPAGAFFTEAYYRGYKAGLDRLKNQAVLSPQLAEQLNNANAQTDFFVIGEIVYYDDLGINRRVNFARRWDGGLRRFTVIPDAYYEREV